MSNVREKFIGYRLPRQTPLYELLKSVSSVTCAVRRLIHTGEKPFICDLQYRFTQIGTLKSIKIL
jgi:hypothetical protein